MLKIPQLDSSGGFIYTPVTCKYNFSWSFINDMFYLEKVDGIPYTPRICRRKISLVKFIKSILEYLGINYTNKKLVNELVLAQRLARLQDSNILSLSIDMLCDLLATGALSVFQGEKLTPKPKLNYVVGVSKPLRNGDYVYIDINLVSTIDKCTIFNWYNLNKTELFDMIKLNCSYKSIPIDYMQIGAVTLLKGNTLHFVLELKEGLQ